MKNKLIISLMWKMLERFGVQGVQFIVQIILARILAPEHYGTLSMMLIFTNLANVFIQNGFNAALIQNKKVTEEDYSSVFWVSLVVSILMYILLFMTAPLIASFYDMPDLVKPFRVLLLVLIPGALNSVQLAKVSREMDFKKVFRSNLIAIIVSGSLGIVFAYLGAGLWALVVQSLTNVVIACLVMWFTVKWRPSLVCNIARIKELFSFGWKMLVTLLIDTLYQDLRSLVIGKKYDSNALGYYNRGKQFPQFIMGAINGALQSVMLPALSVLQDNKNTLKNLMRNSISISAYILFPLMTGLAAVADSLVIVLLTEKWLPCVPYLKIYCFTLAFSPIHTCNLQAINAMGRSDLFLKLEIIKKTLGVIILVIAVVCFDSPIAIAMTGVLITITGLIVNAYPNTKLLSYSYLEQVKDVLPSLIMSLVMYIGVYIVGKIEIPTVGLLFVQTITGVIIYVIISIIIRPTAFKVLMNILKEHKIGNKTN